MEICFHVNLSLKVIKKCGGSAKKGMSGKQLLQIVLEEETVVLFVVKTFSSNLFPFTTNFTTNR